MQRFAAAVSTAVLLGGCGLLPWGGDDEAGTPPPAAGATTVPAEAPATTAAPAVVVLSPADVPQEASTAADSVSDLVDSVPEAVDAISDTEDVVHESAAPAQAETEHSSDPTGCAETSHGEWTVGRIRDGSCAGWAEAAEGEPGTAFGLVCRWVGPREHEMAVFARYPHLDERLVVSASGFRYWILPVLRHGHESGRQNGWQAAELPAPSIEAEGGLLIARREAPPQTEAGEASPLDPQSSDLAESATTRAAGSSEAHPYDDADPARVVFAPARAVDDFATGEDALLTLFGGSNAERFGRPLELWLEGKLTVLEEAAEGETEEGEEDEPEPMLLDERAIFPLTGAAQALRIVTEDCRRLNRDASLGDEAAARLLDGFVLAQPVP
ncbi:MAG: hypothetical protein OXF61_05230 [Acidimicrobiaceae bacterium]|nr:hypothetical protein [Acidimicrobiaceae bacterium]